ncbi:MAG: glycosyltransferase family A protein [Cyanobacteria bacterium P01_H01_bin.150]
MTPLVSILIPAYNSEEWISETIESAIAQTWNNIEIIIVDDGSKDNTFAVAKKYGSAKIKVISQPNKGASASRNRAFREAQGDFIQYLDADDLLAPDKIELQIRLAENTTSDFLIAGEWARFYQNFSEALFVPQTLWADMLPVDWLLCAWENHYMMHPAAWLVPRKLSQMAGSWNENLSLDDDGEYFGRVILASQGVKFCWGAKSYYRSGISGSLSGSKSQKAWESAFLSLSLGTSSLLAIENSPRTRHASATVFQRFVYEVYPDALNLRQKAELKVQEFGGSSIKPSGGVMFQILSGVLNWKCAKLIQNFVYKYGYKKAAWGWKLAKARKRFLYR